MMAQLLGGVFGVFVLYSIWEWAFFMRIFNDPLKGKLSSVLAAYLTASTIYGFASANGGRFVADGFFIYLLGAFVVSIYAWRRAEKLKDASGDEAVFE